MTSILLGAFEVVTFEIPLTANVAIGNLNPVYFLQFVSPKYFYSGNKMHNDEIYDLAGVD